MKQKIRYICEKCGAEYMSETEASECENAHAVPVELDMRHIHYRNRMDYSEWKYPTRIRVKMNNGDIITYSYDRGPVAETDTKGRSGTMFEPDPHLANKLYNTPNA